MTKTAREIELEEALLKLTRAATRQMRVDSCGRPQAYIPVSALQEARNLLGVQW